MRSFWSWFRRSATVDVSSHNAAVLSGVREFNEFEMLSARHRDTHVPPCSDESRFPGPDFEVPTDADLEESMSRASVPDGRFCAERFETSSYVHLAGPFESVSEMESWAELSGLSEFPDASFETGFGSDSLLPGRSYSKGDVITLRQDRSELGGVMLCWDRDLSGEIRFVDGRPGHWAVVRVIVRTPRA